MLILTLPLLTLLGAGQPVAVPLAPEAQVHLGIALRPTHQAEMDALRAAQQQPGNPAYHRWLTPQEFGERFGQAPATYAKTVAWLTAAGFQVTRYPSQMFVEATGTAAGIRKLFGVGLQSVPNQPGGVHVPTARPELPAWLSPIVLDIGGLDTRQHFHHRISVTGEPPAFGPQDLRAFYDVNPLFASGYVGQGQKLVVLSTAEPPGSGASQADIQYFLSNISDVQTPFIPVTLPNPGNDIDNSPGGGVEFDLDVEMQSVGSPGADSISLVISPASEVFLTGASYIANMMSDATAVSVSLGNCEQNEQEFDQQSGTDEASALRSTVQQGVMEGQTWSAASGDNGADDCQDGMTVSVDFPSSIPEFVAAGGSELKTPPWNASNALTAYTQETVWDDGNGGGAAGGGISILFTPEPDYQSQFAFTGRSVPDLALMAGLPGVATNSSLPGVLQTLEGTSVASPLSAGFFALIASRVGCRLGDPHAALYALGALQQDGGFSDGGAPFNDITQGNNTYDNVAGQTAGPGYDSASGWGSLDVTALANAWPPCFTFVDGGTDAGQVPVGAYSQCGYLACDAGNCTTLIDGPSSCLVTCPLTDAGVCTSGTICTNETLFAPDGGGACVPGCLQDSDCHDPNNPACNTCEEVCGPAGNDSANIGDPCQTAADCTSGGTCITSRGFDGGYCSLTCVPGSTSGTACGCPSSAICVEISRNGSADCLSTCDAPGTACTREGYLCQSVSNGAACLTPCRVTSRNGTTTDTCLNEWGSTLACDVDSGYCGGPAVADAGPVDAGTPDAGMVDAGTPTDAGTPIADAGVGDGGTTTTPKSSGCGCTPGGSPDALLGLLAFAPMLRRRRRR